MSTWRRRGLVIIGGLAIAALAGLGVRFVLFSGPGAAATGTTLSIVSSDVMVQDQGTDDLRPAVDGETLDEGDRVVTGDGGRAIITLFDGSTQELEPDTDVTIESFGMTDEGNLSATIDQAIGSTWNSILTTTGSPSRVAVTTPAAVGAVRDTLFQVDVTTDGTTSIRSQQGSVSVLAQGIQEVVSAGTQSTTTPGAPPARPEPSPPPKNEIRLELASAAWMLLIDPAGLSAGIVPPGVPVNQIPLTLATDYTQEPQLISVSTVRQGTYQVYLLAKETGDYHLSAKGIARGLTVLQRSFAGTVKEGDIWKTELEIDLERGLLVGWEFTPLARVDEPPPAKIVIQERVLQAIQQGQGFIPGGAALAAGSTPVSTATPTPTPTPAATPTPTVTPTPTATATTSSTASPTPTATTTLLSSSSSSSSSSTSTSGSSPSPPPPGPTPTPTPTPTPPPAGTLTGTVLDASAPDPSLSPVGGATVSVVGTGLSTVTSSTGSFTISGVPTGNQSLRVSRPGYISHTLPVQVIQGTNPSIVIGLSPALLAGEIRIVLTWASQPADLDAHLSGPMCGTTDRFHIAPLTPSPVPYASRNVDDATGFGPETITISRFNGNLVEGEYDYWVHNFGTSSPEFAASNAVVTIYQGTLQIQQYLVRNEAGVSTTTLRIWRVFNLFIDPASTVTINRQLAGFYDGTEATVLPTVTAPAPAACGTAVSSVAAAKPALNDPLDMSGGLDSLVALAPTAPTTARQSSAVSSSRRRL